jgi:hypothetical protein
MLAQFNKKLNTLIFSFKLIPKPNKTQIHQNQKNRKNGINHIQRPSLRERSQDDLHRRLAQEHCLP